jgi:hypothetical protein
VLNSDCTWIEAHPGVHKLSVKMLNFAKIAPLLARSLASELFSFHAACTFILLHRALMCMQSRASFRTSMKRGVGLAANCDSASAAELPDAAAM